MLWHQTWQKHVLFRVARLSKPFGHVDSTVVPDVQHLNHAATSWDMFAVRRSVLLLRTLEKLDAVFQNISLFFLVSRMLHCRPLDNLMLFDRTMQLFSVAAYPAKYKQIGPSCNSHKPIRQGKHVK